MAQPDNVDAALTLLRSKERRADGAVLLRSAVNTAARELSKDAFAFFESSLFRRIFEMVHSSDVQEKRGAVAALEALIDAPSSSDETKVIKVANTFKHIISSAEDGQLLEDVARALGSLASQTSAHVPNNDYVEFELSRGLEWLFAEPKQFGGRKKRLAACLVLRELAKHTPTPFFVRSGDFFDRIWPVLKDPSQPTRDAAADALAAALSVLADRPSVHHLPFYFRCYENIQSGLDKGGSNAEEVHGALRAVGAILLHCGSFMVPRFHSLCEAVLAVAERHRQQRLLRLTVVLTLPQLASFAPDAFARSYLRPSLDLLMRCARPSGSMNLANHSQVRRAALLALGQLALSVKDQLGPDLPKLVELVREGMSHSGRGAPALPGPALTCTSNLVEALGPLMSPAIPSLLGPMMRTGLSEGLIQTLTIVARVLPEHQELVHRRLLDELSSLLSGAPFAPPGTSLQSRRPQRHPCSNKGAAGKKAVAEAVAAAAAKAAAAQVTAAAVAAVTSAAPGESPLATDSSNAALPGGCGGGGGGDGGSPPSLSASPLASPPPSPSRRGISYKPQQPHSQRATSPKQHPLAQHHHDEFQRRQQPTQRGGWGAGGGGGGGGGGGAAGSRRGGGVGVGRLGLGMGRLDHKAQSDNVASVVLGLQTLASVPMDTLCLLPLVRDCLVHYLVHAVVSVRVEAVVACARLLVNNPQAAPSQQQQRGQGQARSQQTQRQQQRQQQQQQQQQSSGAGDASNPLLFSSSAFHSSSSLSTPSSSSSPVDHQGLFRNNIEIVGAENENASLLFDRRVSESSSLLPSENNNNGSFVTAPATAVAYQGASAAVVQQVLGRLLQVQKKKKLKSSL
jgi:hypothetical protein